MVNKSIKRIIKTLLLQFFVVTGFAQNPITPGILNADPAAIVHNGMVYLYAGNDEAAVGASFYRMNNWKCFTTTDMVNWQDRGVVFRVSDVSWSKGDAWAGEVEERNGKFYYYFCAEHRSGGKAVGVAVADNPLGPFKDVGYPLITNNMTNYSSTWDDIDPTVLIDDDGQAYMYWGNSQCYYVKLKSNMTEIDGSIVKVNLPVFTEAPYVHKKNGIYYLSYAYGWEESIAYATSNSITGPWTFKNVIMANSQTPCNTNHQSIIEFKGRDYFIYHSYFSPNGSSFRRSVCVEDLYYNANGTIKTILATTKGATPVAATVDLKEGYYQIKPVHSGLCMQTNNTPTQQTCTTSSNQIWKVIKDGDNYQLLNLESNKYWSQGSGVQGENTGLSTTPISLTLTDAGNDNFYLSPKGNTNLVFDVNKSSTSAGELTLLWTNTEAANQRFTFVPVNVVIDCNGDANGTATKDACGVCVVGKSLNKTCVGSIEAEEACSVDGIRLESSNAGFMGEGYVNANNAIGAGASWELNSTSAQKATIGFRYANGGTTSRDGSLSINGAAVGNVVLSPTGAWTTWIAASVNVDLVKGTNKLVLNAITAEGLANIDVISFSAGVSTVSCLITSLNEVSLNNLTVYPVPTSGVIYLTSQEPLNWILYNQIGREIQKGKSTQLDLSNEEKGVYLLKVKDQMFKVMKH